MAASDRLFIVREDGDLLAVSHGARLRGPCVKCAADATASRHELFQHVPSWTWLLLCTGVVGIIVVAFLQRSGAATLPICADCDARWRKVARLRSWTALALVPASMLAMAALVADARGAIPPGAGTWTALAIALAWTAAFVAVRLRRSRLRLVTASAITRELLFLRDVHPDARRALVAEAVAVRLH